MRSGSVWLLVAVLAWGLDARAEEQANTPAPVQEVSALPDPSAALVTELQQRLEVSEQQRTELALQLEQAASERENAQLSRLRQENQRLKLQLKAAQSAVPPPLLTEQQQWFVAGGGLTLAALLLGVLAGSWRKPRRHWLD